MTEVTARLPAGQTTRIAMYRRRGSSSTSWPLLAISPPPAADASADDRFLHELYSSLSETNPAGGQIARFELFVDQQQDRWTEPSSFNPEQLERLRRFVRSRLFDVWRALSPQLAKLTGTFEMMNPAHGANMGWHQDGHAAGEYIGHYYLSSGGPAEAPEHRTVAEGTGWCEVALPPLEPDAVEAAPDAEAMMGGEEADEEVVYELDFRSDGGLSRGGVSRASFVPFAVGRPTAAQRLVLFEDAKVFHRTPLTAYSLRDLQASRQRPMARFVLYGSSGAGDAVGLSVPAHAAAMTDVELALPTGLRRFVEDYAAQPGVSRTKALDAYVAGDSDLVRHLVAAQASVAE